MNVKQPYRLIISGGGTGGHIFPALAIADEFRRRHPDAQILFVGAKGRMEMKRVPEAGYRIIGLWISGIQRRLSLSNLLLPVKLLVSYITARRIIKNFRPHAVVGTGGYASGPILLAATRMRIPTLIQEQNSHAGIANRQVARKVQRICVAYENMEHYFPAEKIRLTGNPVRKDIIRLSEKRERAYAHFGFSPAVKTLFVMGGSLGARTINESIRLGIEKIRDAGIQLIWQCGNLYYKEYDEWLSAYDRRKIRLYGFLREMDMAYAVADVVISRAGALAVSELSVAGKATIFVPSPNVAEDHQTKNARVLADRGAALLITDEQARTALVDEAIHLLFDEQRARGLSANILSMAKPHATEEIVNELEKIMGIRANGSNYFSSGSPARMVDEK
ncbi:MAG: undecaprenyldiphospho-muramoylpentapeptide beta-N-acetylglucosaminyltransferase [Cyclobacteriaceae bacterium]|nr:undecaprenyldiphospho-muramoylpentapeptide beta-N-acetylglucosaminyltransferase [Cyclobacteriaceae bacterium]